MKLYNPSKQTVKSLKVGGFYMWKPIKNEKLHLKNKPFKVEVIKTSQPPGAVYQVTIRYAGEFLVGMESCCKAHELFAIRNVKAPVQVQGT